ncbi:MAG: cupin domain-containing protein [Anaerolineae bacterium]|nr:cupin domain-containing protein [Anaerolineae bacterium]
MKTISLMDDLVFGEQGPYAQQLNSDQLGKIVRYTLKPGQELDETHAPFMPRYFVVLKGTGVFKSENGEEQRVGPGSVVIFAPKEENSIAATDEDVVVIGFLYWATGG